MQEKETRKKKRFPFLLILETVVSITVIFMIYEVFVVSLGVQPLFWVYYVATLALALVYILYNHGITKKVTPEMLPPDMTEAEKDAFIADVEKRKRRSRFLLILLAGFIFTFAYDVLQLFLPDYLLPVKGWIDSWLN